MECTFYANAAKDMPAIIAALAATRTIINIIKTRDGFLVLHDTP